ncbi:uncharacterized protein LOC133839922 [Drosophila sulfurigaster albostrigata]|uniref:uncharacterized protein LOC133839922 n=1 Tax=Drosophila sulfurigaster albostrigata TaxID=89887 RepID=UPI002D21A334|nr:uncharacterized protein LOC133839922 [Drosophila sulfurigaster albostrigata]
MRQSSRHLRHADWGTWEQGRRGNNCPKGIARWQLLEELTLSYHFRLPFFNDGIVSLPNLQSITFYQNELENDLDEMIKERWKDVHKMILNDCIDKYSLEKLRKLTSLRHLTIVHDEFFTRGIINKVVEKMNQLEQLDLVDFENWYSDDGLWQLVGYCPLLRILNISGMDLKSSFFNLNRSLMEKTMKKHCQTLTLYCGIRDSEIEELFRQHFNHPEVTLSFEPLNVELLNSNMVKIHF